ncbi:MAG: NAD(P)H-dependent oxidoreductase [Spirochaetes bacterium]|nr:NAD(P)H-dependent oxidoreductase [Spirochaetota bacterium]MBN2769464.1 NAD(P)H-dependent oxidoreductase [Spirochaetota bacterium]
MKASVILAHPYPKSFNNAIYQTVVDSLKKNNVVVYGHDLYKENFQPVLSESELGTDQSEDILVKQYARELVDSDVLIFIHPNWWGQPPAILKGYIDRVIRPPYSYDFPENDSGGGLPIAKLDIKYAIVYNTANTDENRELNYFGDPLENIWGKCVFGFLGINDYHRKMFRIIADSSEVDRKNWLDEVKTDMEKLCCF